MNDVLEAAKKLSAMTLITLIVVDALVEGSLNSRRYRLCRLAVASNGSPFLL